MRMSSGSSKPSCAGSSAGARGDEALGNEAHEDGAGGDGAVKTGPAKMEELARPMLIG